MIHLLEQLCSVGACLVLMALDAMTTVFLDVLPLRFVAQNEILNEAATFNFRSLQ